MGKTDHSEDIKKLREHVATEGIAVGALAADLLEMHDRQSLSLDNWLSARSIVEDIIGHAIEENHV